MGRELAFLAFVFWLERGSCGRNNGELAGIRTQDPRLKRALLYQLSYELVPGLTFSKTNIVGYASRAEEGAGSGASAKSRTRSFVQSRP